MKHFEAQYINEVKQLLFPSNFCPIIGKKGTKNHFVPNNILFYKKKLFDQLKGVFSKNFGYIPYNYDK